MKNVDIEAKMLLDKLYNLRSSDSIILVKMEEEKEIALQTKERTIDEKDELNIKIKSLKEEEILLNKEGKLLKEALQNVNRESFEIVFEKLNIDFNPGSLAEKVEKTLPITIETVKYEISDSTKRLDEVVRDMNDSITSIDELEIRREEALTNQQKLNEYFELALSGNINITRDQITALLDRFELSDAERRESAKLLMFPEDGLFDYERYYKDAKRRGLSFTDVYSEPKHEEPHVSNKVISYEKEEIIVPIKRVEEPKVEVKKTSVQDILSNNGFNATDFSLNDLAFVEDNFKEEVLVKNINVIKELGLNSDIFLDNIELFVDEELKEKLDTLLNVGKVPFDIYLNPSILVKYDINELKRAIETLKNSGLDPKKVPLMAY